MAFWEWYYRYCRQNKKKKTFIAFKIAYHGDTVGAMSLAGGSYLFSVFKELFFKIKLFDYPSTWQGDKNIKKKEKLMKNWRIAILVIVMMIVMIILTEQLLR